VSDLWLQSGILHEEVAARHFDDHGKQHNGVEDVPNDEESWEKRRALIFKVLIFILLIII